jgi:hypothetical protein
VTDTPSDRCNYGYDLASSEKIHRRNSGVSSLLRYLRTVSASYPFLAIPTWHFARRRRSAKVDRNTAPTYLAYYPKAAHWSFIDKALNHPRVRAQALASSKPSDDDVELLLRRPLFARLGVVNARRLSAKLHSSRHQKLRGRERRKGTRASSSASLRTVSVPTIDHPSLARATDSRQPCRIIA